ncbi:MAG: FG-GAP repeat protein [Proteobacteria bacterium]|nr:FG-GAP repeat protein [Pseudomonadota bacterium]
MNGSNGFRIDGADFSQVQTVGRAGDINGDGLDDLIIGGSKATGAGGLEAGVSFVVFGTDADPVATIDLGALERTIAVSRCRASPPVITVVFRSPARAISTATGSMISSSVPTMLTLTALARGQLIFGHAKANFRRPSISTKRWMG